MCGWAGGWLWIVATGVARLFDRTGIASTLTRNSIPVPARPHAADLVHSAAVEMVPPRGPAPDTLYLSGGIFDPPHPAVGAPPNWRMQVTPAWRWLIGSIGDTGAPDPRTFGRIPISLDLW